MNKTGKPPLLSQIAPPDYSDLPLHKYIKTLPLQTHRSCYWNKCAFCDGTYLQNFSVKKISDLISEIKQNIKEYGITKYVIIDPAVHPKYLNSFCDEIIKNKINISFDFEARLEPEFTYDLLKKAKECGANCIWWGMESINPRILKLINKGIKVENIKRIMTDSANLGIKNIVFAFIGFPSETEEEAMETVKFLLDNKDILEPILYSFSLGKYSHVYKHPDKYSIEISPHQDEFSIFVRYTSKTGMNKKKITEILEYFYMEMKKDKS